MMLYISSIKMASAPAEIISLVIAWLGLPACPLHTVLLRLFSQVYNSRIIVQDIEVFKNVAQVLFVRLLTDNKDFEYALLRAVKDKLTSDLLLKSSVTGKLSSINEAFLSVVQKEGLFNKIYESNNYVKIRIHARYLDDDHFFVETDVGVVRIREIQFQGELRLEKGKLPLVESRCYEHANNNEIISQLVSFAPIELPSGNFSIEMHRIGQDGETYVLLRKTSER